MELQAGVNWAKHTAETLKTACQRFLPSFKKIITSKLAFTTHTGYNSQCEILSRINAMSRIILPSSNQSFIPCTSGSPSAYDRLAFLPYPELDVIVYGKEG
jgi:hypothetical protein